MKKIVLTVISVLILVFASILVYHITNEDPKQSNQIEQYQVSTDEISLEIDNLTMDENDEIEIGEMI